MKARLSPSERRRKLDGLVLLRLVFEKVGMDYFLSGNVLLDVMREGKISNWPYAVPIAVKHEDITKYFKVFKKECLKSGFTRVTKNKATLRFKVSVYLDNIRYELPAWYKNDTGEYRVRAKYKLPARFFTPGHFEKFHGGLYQTFNPPIEYFEWRFIDWTEPVRKHGAKRRQYEKNQYRR